MLRTQQLGVLLAVAAVASPVADAGASSRPSCRGSGKTVATNAQVRVFRVGRLDSHRLYACWLRNRRVRWIAQTDTSSPDGFLQALIDLRGKWIALYVSSWPREGNTCTSGLELVNAYSGRSRAASYQTCPRLQAALSGDGVLAFSKAANDEAATVEKLTLAGRSVLDESPGIEFGSVSIAESRIYWMRDGAPQTALAR